MKQAMTLGDRLVMLREERSVAANRKITQAEVADAVGISREFLAGIETGHDKPGHDSFVALADYYDVSLDWLARGDPHPRSRASENISKFISDFDVLPGDEQAVFEHAIDFRARQLRDRNRSIPFPRRRAK